MLSVQKTADVGQLRAKHSLPSRVDWGVICAAHMPLTYKKLTHSVLLVGKAAHYGTSGICDAPPEKPSTSMEPWIQLRSTIWRSGKQRFITCTKCSRESSHFTQRELHRYSCALLHQPDQLHGTVHYSRLDELFSL